MIGRQVQFGTFATTAVGLSTARSQGAAGAQRSGKRLGKPGLEPT